MIISLKSELTFDIKTNFRILDKYFHMTAEKFLNYSYTPFHNENYTFILVLTREWRKFKCYTFLYYFFQ